MTAHQPDRVPVADIAAAEWKDASTPNDPDAVVPGRGLPGWLATAFHADAWRYEGGVVSVRIAPDHYDVAYEQDALVRDGDGVRIERGTAQTPAPPAVAAVGGPGRVGAGDRTLELAQDATGRVDAKEFLRRWAEAMKRPPVVLTDPPVDEAALRGAYWKIREHADGYEQTDTYRRAVADWVASDRTDQDARRRVTMHRSYAAGLRSACRDIAELLGVPETEIEPPARQHTGGTDRG